MTQNLRVMMILFVVLVGLGAVAVIIALVVYAVRGGSSAQFRRMLIPVQNALGGTFNSSFAQGVWLTLQTAAGEARVYVRTAAGGHRNGALLIQLMTSADFSMRITREHFAGRVLERAGIWHDVTVGEAGFDADHRVHSIHPERAAACLRQSAVRDSARTLLEDGFHYVFAGPDGVSAYTQVLYGQPIEAQRVEHALSCLVRIAEGCAVIASETAPVAEASSVNEPEPAPVKQTITETNRPLKAVPVARPPALPHRSGSRKREPVFWIGALAIFVILVIRVGCAPWISSLTNHLKTTGVRLIPEIFTVPFLNIPAALLLTLVLLVLAVIADRRPSARDSAHQASHLRRFLIGAFIPALLPPPLLIVALLLGTLGGRSHPAAEFFGLGLLLMLISLGPLVYMLVLFVNDRLVRRDGVEKVRDAFLWGALVPIVLIIFNLAMAPLMAMILFHQIVPHY